MLIKLKTFVQVNPAFVSYRWRELKWLEDQSRRLKCYQLRLPNICGFQSLKSEDLWIFSVLYNCKWNIFKFWKVGLTNKRWKTSLLAARNWDEHSSQMFTGRVQWIYRRKKCQALFSANSIMERSISYSPKDTEEERLFGIRQEEGVWYSLTMSDGIFTIGLLSEGLGLCVPCRLV